MQENAAKGPRQRGFLIGTDEQKELRPYRPQQGKNPMDESQGGASSLRLSALPWAIEFRPFGPTPAYLVRYSWVQLRSELEAL